MGVTHRRWPSTSSSPDPPISACVKGFANMLFNRAGSHEAPLSVIYIPSSTFDCFLAVYPKMKAVFACVVALVAGASAFNVAVPAARLTAARTSSTAVKAGYVPDGVSVKDWEAMKKAKSQKVASNKKYYKEKQHEDLDTFMKGMEKGTRGHTFAKVDNSLTKLMPAGARGVNQN